MAPTFTPAASASSVRATGPASGQAVVRPDCLRGLTSYRFTGSFSLRSATPIAAGAPTPAQGGALAGSLANLLSDVSFQGVALAPDRYQAVIGFGGGGVQTMEIIRVGLQSYSRFGSAAWQAGDQSEGLGAIGQFDPEALCERSLVQLSAAGQSPAHETVNDIPALRYELRGSQIGRPFFGGAPAGRTPVVGPAAAPPSATVWVAEKGGYPVRLQITGASEAGSINLRLDISDVNGKDIQINPPD